MESNHVADVVIHVDPTCPFAWITSEWLVEVEQHGVGVRRELMSLSVVNEGRELDDWYREYNEGAWRPARVAAALLESPDAARWPAFYATFGHRRHVEGLRDDHANLVRTLHELQLPERLIEAVEDAGLDDVLRRRTATAVATLGDSGGTPIVHVGDRAFFGPVLTAVPRAEHALSLWQAVRTLAGTPAFSEIKGVRDEDLHTS